MLGNGPHPSHCPGPSGPTVQQWGGLPASLGALPDDEEEPRASSLDHSYSPLSLSEGKLLHMMILKFHFSTRMWTTSRENHRQSLLLVNRCYGSVFLWVCTCTLYTRGDQRMILRGWLFLPFWSWGSNLSPDLVAGASP